jgi:hypothetical protein
MFILFKWLALLLIINWNFVCSQCSIRLKFLKNWVKFSFVIKKDDDEVRISLGTVEKELRIVPEPLQSLREKQINKTNVKNLKLGESS